MQRRRTRVAAALTADAPLLAAVGLALVAAVGLAAASIFRHDHFGSNAKDLGVYDQTIWGYSVLDVIPNTVTGVPNLLGDHFQPILVVFAPLFWIWDDVRMLLVAQAALLAAASIPVFLYARAVLGVLPALCFQAAYLVFWGMIAGALYDFHEVALAAPILSVAMYALLRRRTGLVWAMAALAFLTKENLALTFVGIALFAALVQRRWRLGLALGIVSAAWFVLVLEVVIPSISGERYAHWEYPALGDGPGEALRHLVAHPVDSVQLFFTPGTKRQALFNLFGPWLFLPVVSPLLLPSLPSLAERFLSSRPEFWGQSFHYSLTVAPLLAFAAVDTTTRLGQRLSGRRRAVAGVLGALTLAAGLAFTFGRTKPLDQLQRYTTERQIAQIDECLATVPPHASVAATSALVPHLTHRRTIYVLDEHPVATTDYYAIDTSTWRFPLELSDIKRVLERKLAAGYGVVCSRGGTVVLARGAPGKSLDPELRRLLERS